MIITKYTQQHKR
jgi:hypothetical protein